MSLCVTFGLVIIPVMKGTIFVACKYFSSITIRSLVTSVFKKNIFSYFSTKTYVVFSQKNCLKEHPKHMINLMGSSSNSKVVKSQWIEVAINILKE